MQDRFVEEARLLRRIRSHHVVTVHDVGRLGDGRPYFVMDFADGGTLADWLERRRDEHPSGPLKIEPRELLATADGIADGLAAIHRAGVVHRDIKPANILFLGNIVTLHDPDMTIAEPASAGPVALANGNVFEHARVVVGDLGIAMDVARAGAMPTMVGGTSAYSAPEQLDPSEPVSPAADIYSATAVLFHLLTGAKPPRADRVQDYLSSLPERWREIVRCGLALAPGDRFGSIRSWHAAVEDVLTQEAAEAEPAPPIALINPSDGAAHTGCPYKGLGSYQMEDADNFYGREALTEDLVRRLQMHNVLVIGGPSGSGKSSLMRAGLIPALKAGAAAGSAGWRTVLMTPGRDAMAELYFRLAQSHDCVMPVIAAADLMASPSLARRLAHPTGTEPPLVLCIDQFEELFTLCQPAQRDAFVEALASMTDPADSRVRIAIAVRADYYVTCAQIPWLAERTTENQVLVGPMSQAELRRAITEPARNAELYLERHLVDAILETAEDEAGSLPLVAHALVETWKRRRGSTLTLEGYRAAGGVAGAIAQTANAIYETQFGAAERDATHRLFLRLVTPGEGAGDTRRIVDRAELADDLAPEVTERVVAQLTDARLLTVDEETVQIAHEALLRSWPRLRGWIDEARDDLRTRQRLIRYAEEWDASGHDADLLLRGTPLLAAMDWSEKHPNQGGSLVTTFIAASEEEKARAEAAEQVRRRRARRARIAAVTVLSVLAVGTTVASVIAYFGYREANRNEERAAAATREADARFALALGAVGAGLSEDDPLLALFLGGEAVARADDHPPGFDGRAAMVAARRTLSSELPHVIGSPIQVGDALSLAISPDSAFVAVGGRDGTIKIFDTVTRRPVGQPKAGHEGGIEDLEMSPDGRQLASAGSDGTVRLWTLQDGFLGDGKVIAHFDDVAWTVAFDPSGEKIAAASEDQTVRVWDASTGAPVGGPVATGVGDALSVAFGPDGKSLFVGLGTGEIRGWTLPDNAEIMQAIQDVHTADVWTLIFSPAGDLFATVSADGTAALFSYPEVRFSGRAFDKEERISSAAFTPDSRALLGAGEDGRLHVWDIAGRTEVGDSAVGHTGRILELVTPKTGHLAATLGRDQTVRMWSVFDPKTMTTDRSLSGAPAKGVAIGIDGTVAGADISGKISVWRPGAAEPITLGGHDHQVWALAVSPDGRFLASGDRSGKLQVWDLQTREPVWTRSDGGGAIWSLDFTPDGRTLVAAEDAEVDILNAANDERTSRFEPEHGRVTRAALSADGKRVAVTTTAGRVSVLELPGGRQISDFQVVDDVAWSAAFSPDDRFLAVASSDEVVSIWDLETGKRLADLAGHSGGATDLAFLSNGASLAVVDRQGRLHLWDTVSQRRLAAPIGAHERASWRLSTAFPGADVFVTSGDDGMVREWDVLDVGRACKLGARGFDRQRRLNFFGEEPDALACEAYDG